MSFRAAREARHLSLSDVSEHIHIRSVYLQGIEEEDWSSIGAPVYVRGFIRTYARFLAIDAERCVEYFNAAVGRAALPAPASRPVLLRHPFAAVAMALARGDRGPALSRLRRLHVLRIANEWRYRADRDRLAEARRPLRARSPRPHPGRRLPPGRVAVAPKRTLQVDLTQTSWVLVQIDGSPVLEGHVSGRNAQIVSRRSRRRSRRERRRRRTDGQRQVARQHGPRGATFVQRTIPLVAE